MTARPLLAAALAGAALFAGAAHAGSLDLRSDADAADVGLPAYPGAIKKTDRDGDHEAFSFGVRGERFGLQVAVVAYRSVDAVDKVAAFYRDALGRYGPVLDCSRNHGDGGSRYHREKGDDDRPVTCGDDAAEAGGRLFKVGTNAAQRIVKIRPWHDGASFELVRVEHRGDE